MKKKNLTIIVLCALVIINLFVISIKNVNLESATELVSLAKYDGSSNVTYRGTNIEVKIPATYVGKTAEFRAVWVSAYAGDVVGFTGTEASWRSELTTLLNTMEQFGLNAAIFHVRTHNDAFYNTRLAPKSNYINNADFSKWDYLEWFIGECHSRGIEFHAWLNPYRLGSSTNVSSYTSAYAAFPLNPASKAENIITGSGGAILDPGRPEVKNFLVNVCMELIRKYDIDAIHFDDYFYISGVNDTQTYNLYKSQYGNPTIADFRRLQIDDFISKLSTEMMTYNLANDRCVQLGISPSGVYRNGSYSANYVYDANGTLTSPLTSNSAGYSHYDSPLYSDTKKWIDNEWIDYIIPQLYASFENTAMPYADMVDWWSAVVKNKKVNLYIGIGLYKKNQGVDGYPDAGWYAGSSQLSNQLLYNTKFSEVQGFSLYQYRSLKTYAADADVKKVQTEYWSQKALHPVLQRYQYNVGNIQHFDIYQGQNNYSLAWKKNDNAAKYAIFRSTNQIDLNDGTQIIALTGNNQNSDLNHYVDRNIEAGKIYNYAVVSLSKSNELGNKIEKSVTQAKTKIDFEIGAFSELVLTGTINRGGRLTLSFTEMNIYAGGTPTYTIYISTNQNDWEVIDELTKPNGAGIYSKIFYFPKEELCLYIKVVAKNEFGQITSEIIRLNVLESNPTIIFDDILTQHQVIVKSIFEN